MLDFEAKMHQNQFPLGLCPRPREGAYNAAPDPLAGLKGAYLYGQEGKGREGKGMWGKREGKGDPVPDWEIKRWQP